MNDKNRRQQQGRRSAAEYWLLCRGLAGSVASRLGLMVLPLAVVRKAVRFFFASDSPLPPERRCSAEQVIRAAVSAGIHSPVGSTCLSNALVAQAMLQRHGYDATLRLGVKRDANGAFCAHAWVERDGRIVVGGPPAEISKYTSLPDIEHLIR